MNEKYRTLNKNQYFVLNIEENIVEVNDLWFKCIYEDFNEKLIRWVLCSIIKLMQLIYSSVCYRNIYICFPLDSF